MISHIDGQLLVFTWRNIPEVLTFQQNRWDNLKSYGNVYSYWASIALRVS